MSPDPTVILSKALKDIADGWDHETSCPFYTEPDKFQATKDGVDQYGSVPCRSCTATDALSRAARADKLRSSV